MGKSDTRVVDCFTDREQFYAIRITADTRTGGGYARAYRADIELDIGF